MNTKIKTASIPDPNPNDNLLGPNPIVPAAFSSVPKLGTCQKRDVTFVWANEHSRWTPHMLVMFLDEVRFIPTRNTSVGGLHLKNASIEVTKAVAKMSGLGQKLIDHVQKLKDDELQESRSVLIEELRQEARQLGMDVVPLARVSGSKGRPLSKAELDSWVVEISHVKNGPKASLETRYLKSFDLEEREFTVGVASDLNEVLSFTNKRKADAARTLLVSESVNKDDARRKIQVVRMRDCKLVNAVKP